MHVFSRLSLAAMSLPLLCGVSFATTLTVNSKALDGSNAAQYVTYTAPTTGTYRLRASGYYQYDMPHDSDSYADAGWATWDGWSTVRAKFNGQPVQDQPGGSVMPTPAGLLMLWYNDGVINSHEWGSYNPNHIYDNIVALNAGQTLSFWISDWSPYDAEDYGRPVHEYYYDNVGALTVDITQVPEPSAMISLLCGLGGTGLFGASFRRRRK